MLFGILAAVILLPALTAAAAPGSTASAPLAVSAPQAAEQPSGISPIIVVLDLSGSMNDDDGTGRIKLTGAKTAVENVIRNVPDTQPFGLWTYPDAADDCGAGSFAIPPQPISDVTDSIATVDSLTAEGGTPTGTALQAAADSLTARGDAGATIILVSDGESNCGAPPCDVASGLVTSGFDVTIHAVGFRVSEAGRAELDCVAGAGGGTYVDASDSDQLIDTLHELTRAQLRISTTWAGGFDENGDGMPYLTVALSNTSAITASDVQLSVTAGSATVVQNVPVTRVGNLPPGGSDERIFLLRSDAALSGDFTAAAWARNADRVETGGSLISDSGGTLRDTIGSLLRDPIEAGHPLVILGDSYSSGEGAFDYAKPPEGVSDDCHRSTKTYLMPQLDSGDVINLACSGAVSWDFYHTAENGTPAQLTQLAKLAGPKETPGAVVMTLGGNDVGFADIVTMCVKHDCSADADRIASWNAAIDSLRIWLAPVYEDVWKAINLPERLAQRDGEYAPVIVLGYPQLTHATQYGGCFWSIPAALQVDPLNYAFTAAEVQVANRLAARLNSRIKSAVADARDAGYEVYFAGDTAEAMLPDHTVCESGGDAYVNGVVLGVAKDSVVKPESFHPKVSGYAAETAEIVRWSATVTRTLPDTDRTGPATLADGEPWYLWTFDMPSIDSGHMAEVDRSLFKGGRLAVHVDGYAPGTPVIIFIHSEPAVLGTLVADENGEINGVVHVPDAIELGEHEIVLTGTDEDGVFREDRVAASVLAAPPVWVQLAPIAVGLLLIGALVFLILGWRARLRARRGART